MIKPFLAGLVLFCALAAAPVQTEKNATDLNASQIPLEKQISTDSTLHKKKIEQLLTQKEAIDKELLENNIWFKIYSNYHTYKELIHQKKILDDTIKLLEKRKKRSKQEEEELKQTKQESLILSGKLQLLKEYETDPFKKFLMPPKIENVPTVENPLAIISAYSYREKLHSDQIAYESRYESLKYVLENLDKKKKTIEELLVLEPENEKYQNTAKEIDEQIKTFASVMEIFETTKNVYVKKIDEIKLNLKNDIDREINKTIQIGAIILVFVILLFVIKYFVRRYMSDNERFYIINKALNITFVTFLIVVLLFAYIENVSYLVTILGFASAGIAIAMKEWFMSLMGWLTIIIGGSVHVGDRVKFVRGNVEYVGDIVDISLLRMTLHEDVSLTSIMQNRRAGRIIFIPNNFIFTDMIANYSHAGLKTVWDGIDFVITFDSNIQKAQSIAKEIARKYSKGYTDITRKQLNKLRSSYSMKNTNVEPRIYAFIDTYGIKISTWYMTNAFATLTLRSTISVEIISRLQEEEDIFLAFPTQSIYMDKDVRKPLRNQNVETKTEGTNHAGS
ncbi:MAG: mechanosensitive ion channel [Sulfurovum sp.]|nr:mechanosensitive ion channel [Sulfurovum sp.]